MTKGIKRKIKIAMKNISNNIENATNQNNLWSRGLAREGFDGGYEAALSDVLLVLSGGEPCSRPEFWKEDK